MKYAKNTNVSTEKSRIEIERTLQKYGASGFAYAWQDEKAAIAFRFQNRQVRFLLPLPSQDSREITHNKAGQKLPASVVRSRFEQTIKQRWRSLSLTIKAKLEAVECGITTFEEEFMAHIVLPDGKTVGQWMSPQIARSYENNQMPPLLPYGN